LNLLLASFEAHLSMEDVYIAMSLIWLLPYMASPFIVSGLDSASIPSKLGSNIISEPLPPWPISSDGRNYPQSIHPVQTTTTPRDTVLVLQRFPSMDV
jgi:hypothetical protein